MLTNDYTKKSIEKASSMEWQCGNDKRPGNEVIKLLQTAPYIGEWTAVVWLSIVITTDRFPTAKALSAYCGLDPSLKISAKHVTSTVKRGGNKDLHNALTRAASNLIRLHAEPFGKWGYNLYQQTGRWKKATNAVARKLAVSLYYMQKKGEPFSYEQYELAHDIDVIDIPIESLISINPSFRRYYRSLSQLEIKTTRELIHKYSECQLKSVKGLGKKFFTLVKEFINNQTFYQNEYNINRERTCT